MTLTVLASGVWFSVLSFAGSAILAIALTVAFGCGRLSHSRAMRSFCLVWTEFFRGISTVVLLFWLYYVLPMFGISLSPMAAAITGLGLVHGAYGAEVLRGALQSVAKGQAEAAVALGLSRFQTFRHVTLPQASALVIPVLGNSLVSLLKATALASVIGLPELAYQANLSVSRTYAMAQTFGGTLVLYYLMAQVCQLAVRKLEQRTHRWRPTEFANGF